MEEAQFIATLIMETVSCGLNIDDIAVITPFRKQVRTIREAVKSILGDELPLIDTVERLQGQDVKMIVVSFSVTSPRYFKSNKAFLFNPNRLNVMISRAKQKVIVVGAEQIISELK